MRRIQGFSAINRQTGEILDILVAPRKSHIGGKWVRLFQDMQERLALDKSLHGETRRVLAFLMSKSDYENKVPGPSVVARLMGLRPNHVSRAYSELKRVGVLFVSEGFFILSPELCWKGTEKEFEQVCLKLLNLGPLQLKRR